MLLGWRADAATLLNIMQWCWHKHNDVYVDARTFSTCHQGTRKKKKASNIRTIEECVSGPLVEIKPLQASPAGDIADRIFLVIKVAVVKRKGSSEAQEKRYSLLLTEKKVAFLFFLTRTP